MKLQVSDKTRAIQTAIAAPMIKEASDNAGSRALILMALVGLVVAAGNTASTKPAALAYR